MVISLILAACGPAGSSGDVLAWNYPAQLDRAGVLIQIGRVLFAKQGAFGEEWPKAPYFQDKPVVGELIFVVKNDAGQSMNVYPDQGYVVVDDEHVNLLDVALVGSGGDHLGGEILPDITKIGAVWFGLRRAGLDEIQSMTIVIAGPHDNRMQTRGGAYRFQLDLSDHKNEPIPDELRLSDAIMNNQPQDPFQQRKRMFAGAAHDRSA
jgi:hypothetical protein